MSIALGVLGGMGPLATVDFLRKLIEETPASCDQEHIPYVAYAVPQVPDRTAAILGTGPTPLPALLEGIHTLKQAGAAAIAIPCNTAHYWYDEMVRSGGVPILHIADTALAQLKEKGNIGGSVGLMGTMGTLTAGFFQQRLVQHGYRCIVNSSDDQERLVMTAIYRIKANDLAVASKLIETAAVKLVQEGASGVILACTEIPIVMDRLAPAIAEICVDATRALAKASVEWWQTTQRAQG